ncbi:MAG: right-handed parallel beta-helix repeat-containing protein, partial [Anaerolineae bacterium]|nr:right-handed parallel beta-helix repeat-containing protein [Anaerolineae bacterium]
DSTVIMERNIIHGCGDKGISIGTNPTFPPGTRPASVTVVNTLVYSSYYGIAVKDSAIAHITHCTLSNNVYGLALYEAPDHPGLGGGQAKVINTIVWDNVKHDIYLNLENNPPPSITVSHSDIAGGWPGQDNLNIKPEFKGQVNYHLEDDSPLINMGATIAITQDLEGNPRSIDGRPDIGAYEVQTPTFPLYARAEDRRIDLNWQIPYTLSELHSFAIVYTLSPPGSLSVILPATITGIPATDRAYVLTETINYAWYTFYVEAQDMENRALRRSPTVTAFPSDRRIYLPTILKY